MNDIDTLLERLRAAAVDHASSPVRDHVQVRSWRADIDSGARRALLEAWAMAPSPELDAFLVTAPHEFVEMAYLACLGRRTDPVGQSHYLDKLRQGMPRLELLAHMANSPESVEYRGKPWRPPWLRAVSWVLRPRIAIWRRAARALLRRVEARLDQRARHAGVSFVWQLAGVFDDALAQEMTAVQQRLALAEHEAAATRSLADEHSRQLATLGADVDWSSTALTAMRARMAAVEYGSPAPVTTAATADPGDGALTRYYVTLESVFRGDPARIRTQLEADYLGYMLKAREEAGDGPCLDLGCGRGEWLDVLQARGFVAQGVDLNTAMVAAARQKGHNVSVGDAVAFLRGFADDSALAISAFHLAEHLEFPALFRMVAECRRVLKPGGRLILETPNPENIWVATHTFHHDPTHGNPLTPASLEFLVNHHGLETVEVLRLHPYPPDARLPGSDPATERLNAMTCGGQDFAVIAKKTPTG